MYHVSPVKGIEELKPSISSHGKAYVYAIDILTVALLFGAKKDDFDLLLDVDDGKAVVWECYPDAFKKIYDNKSCSVYTVDERYFKNGQTSWEHEYVCERSVPVLSEKRISNLYLELKNEMEKGNLILNYYSENEAYQKFLKDELKSRMIDFNLIDYFKNDDPRGKLYFQNILNEI